MGDTGLEHPALTPPKTQLSTSGGAESDARDAPSVVHNASLAEANTTRLPADLAEVVATWPELPEHIKTAIKVLVQAHIKEVS